MLNGSRINKPSSGREDLYQDRPPTRATCLCYRHHGFVIAAAYSQRRLQRLRGFDICGRCCQPLDPLPRLHRRRASAEQWNRAGGLVVQKGQIQFADQMLLYGRDIQIVCWRRQSRLSNPCANISGRTHRIVRLLRAPRWRDHSVVDKRNKGTSLASTSPPHQSSMADKQAEVPAELQLPKRALSSRLAVLSSSVTNRYRSHDG